MSVGQRFGRRDFLLGGAGLVVGFAAGAEPGLAQTAGAAKSADLVDSWLALDRGGNVTIFFGKVELGTGIETAISQLVADELDVPFASIRVVQGDTSRVPDQGYTAGSASLQVGSIPVRRAAAQARATLIGLAAQRLGVPADVLQTRDGTVVSSSDPQLRVGYAQLVSGPLDVPVAADVKLKPASAYRVIGKPVGRVDLPAKIGGSFRYVQNVRLPGMMHARMLHPKRLGQHVTHIDATSLGDLAGRVQIVHKNDFVAVVAAREWDAVGAARRLVVGWSDGPPLPPQERLYDVVQQTPGTSRTLVDKGDLARLGSGTAVLRATYRWPFQSHGSIGPSCGVADVSPDKVRIWSGTQGPFPLRRTIAALIGRPADDVEVTYVEASGCYGHNGADDAAAAAAVVSQQLGRPIRMQWMRYDETAWDPKGPAMVAELAATLEGGAIGAWSFQAWSPTHSGRPDGQPATLLAGRLLGLPPPKPSFVGGDRNARTNYDIANQRVVMIDQPTAVLRQSALRGLGGTQNTFANESFVDELAHAAGLDPIAFRLRHLSDPRAVAVLHAVQPAYRPGRGVAFVRYENKNAYVATVVDLDVDQTSGAVKVNTIWVAHDCGLIVNPDGLRNQIEGNAIQASSRALREAVHFDENGVTSVDWLTYSIFRFSDVPQVEITLLDRPDQPILGAGEATTTTIAPAIANAIFARTGVRLRTAPFTPQALKTALAAPPA